MIPFTQFLRPDGRRQKVEAPCTPEQQKVADAFIARGGWFEAEVLTTGHVSLTACEIVRHEFGGGAEPQDVAIELSPNGPEIDDALARLLKKVETL